MRERAWFFFWTGPLKDPAFEPSVQKASIVDKMMDDWIKPGKHQKNPQHWAGRLFLPCPGTGFELASKSVEFGRGFPLKQRCGAAQWNSCILPGGLREQQLMGGGSSLHLMQGSQANSGSQQHVKFAVRCKRVFFADCVTLSFLRRKQGNSALFAWVSHPSPWLRTHCAVRWTAPFWFTALIMFYSRNMVLMSKLMGKILLRSNNIL